MSDKNRSFYISLGYFGDALPVDEIETITGLSKDRSYCKGESFCPARTNSYVATTTSWHSKTFQVEAGEAGCLSKLLNQLLYPLSKNKDKILKLKNDFNPRGRVVITLDLAITHGLEEISASQLKQLADLGLGLALEVA